ncbi:MAG: hypothetical protein ACKPKO_64575, partial [Candidatus Fonsibacter sp.]
MTTPSRQAAAPPSEDVMFMNQRRLINHSNVINKADHQADLCHRNHRYIHLHNQVPNVPVIPISSLSDRHMTPSELYQAG